MRHHLHLLRHAKSSWGDPAVQDIERPLAPRGRRAAAVVAGHITKEKMAPALVVCSSARRTVETLELIRAALPGDAAVSIEVGLYGASAGALLRRLRTVPDDVASVLVVAHNPGIEDLARGLTTGGDPALVDQLETKYPTGGLATLTFEGPWAALDWDRAQLEAFVTPRQLP